MYEPIYDSNNLIIAENIINEYFDDLQYDYGEFAYDYTIHAHLHLPKQVRLHGPLKCNSQFVFEGAIFNLKRILHGTKGFLNQIVKQINNEKDFASSIETETFHNSNLKSFTQSLYNFKAYNNTSNNGLLPILTRKTLDVNHLAIFLDYFDLVSFNDSILTSSRIVFDKKVYHSTDYNRRGNSNSFTVCFSFNNEEYFGDVEFYFEFDSKIYCFINVFELDVYISNYFPKIDSFNYKTFMNYVSDFYAIVNSKKVNKTNIAIISCDLISYKCIKIYNNDNLFISKLKYDFEHD
jgi:hypothetical protein